MRPSRFRSRFEVAMMDNDMNSHVGDANGSHCASDAHEASCVCDSSDMGASSTANMAEPEIQLVANGGVTTASGFEASGVHAGFRKNGSKLDLALVAACEPCATSAVFTQNVFSAAPVQFSKAQLEAVSGSSSYGCAKAVVINSGNANAATGPQGLMACEAEAAMVANAIGCSAQDVLVASTGVIGVQLPMAPFESGVPEAARRLSSQSGHDAALAIMTTDTCAKECAVSFSGEEIGYAGSVFHVGGMAKGSGMIMPNMATMISVITTDAPVLPQDLYALLKHAVDASFNKVTVDSDTSTNDTCIMMASGAAAPGAAAIVPGTKAYDVFARALAKVCTTLARMMARDGEGATKLVDVTVRGAANAKDADAAARTIANSPLVKTAIAGHDANWGRIAGALGRSGASFMQEDVDISILGMPVCKGGLALGFDEDEALRRFEDDEIQIEVDLHAGDFETTIWTCDFTHGYISINGDYRT